jgi:predicted DNA-binding ArsR family transcriptional regulator
MKIRMGFVSNSSSASYIVKLNKTFSTEESLLEDIYDTCWCAIQDEEIRIINEQELWDIRHPKDPNETTIITDKLWTGLSNKEPYVRQFTTNNDSRIYLEDKNHKIEATRHILNELGIKPELHADGCYRLVQFTVMHNSFADMNNLLKNIYFEYLGDNAAEFKFESDD